jgi:hypothetical protein
VFVSLSLRIVGAILVQLGDKVKHLRLVGGWRANSLSLLIFVLWGELGYNWLQIGPIKFVRCEEVKMTSYEPEIIFKFADRLYKQARTAVATMTLVGVLLGFGGGLFLGIDKLSVVGGVVGAVVLGVVGYLAGRERAFRLKLQAQTALCQVKIEENTRR